MPTSDGPMIAQFYRAGASASAETVFPSGMATIIVTMLPTVTSTLATNSPRPSQLELHSGDAPEGSTKDF